MIEVKFTVNTIGDARFVLDAVDHAIAVLKANAAADAAPARDAAERVADRVVPEPDEEQKPQPVAPPAPAVAAPDAPEKRGRGRPRKVDVVPAVMQGAPLLQGVTPPVIVKPAAPAAAAPLVAHTEPKAAAAAVVGALFDKTDAPVADPGLPACQSAIEDLLGARGAEVCIALTTKHSVKRTKDLPVEARNAFIADARRLIAGGAL